MIVVVWAASIWAARFHRSGRADLRGVNWRGNLVGMLNRQPRVRGCSGAIWSGRRRLRRSICPWIALASPCSRQRW